MMGEVYHQPFLKQTVKQLEVTREVVLSEASKLNDLEGNKKNIRESVELAS